MVNRNLTAPDAMPLACVVLSSDRLAIAGFEP